MKRVSVFLIMAALIAGMVGCDGCNPPPSQDLEIRTWYDLDAVRNNLAGNHKLMNDLDSTTPGYDEVAGPTANAGKGWQPIGLYTPHGPTCCSGFAGTFDGQGYEIRDLFINRPDEDDVGLFKYVDRYYGIVEDIGVTNVTVIGRNRVGGLAGDNGGTVSNCYCSGYVSGNGSVGGLAGYGNGIVIDSYSSGSVAGYQYVGGLVGYNFCNLSKSHFAGNVTGSSYVGGLVGYNFCNLSKSHFAGNVMGSSYVGGLVGENWAGGTLSDCYSTGSVTGIVDVGGLVGLSSAESIVSNSYSTGSVTGTSHVGGLVGWNDEGTVSNCFWDIETSGQTHSFGGTGETTAEMQDIITFSGVGWNIIAVANPGVRNPSCIWNIVDGGTYPFLSWQAV